MINDIISELSQYSKIGLCGGASGGHVYPVSSLIQYIQSNSKINSKVQDFYWFGDKHQMEYIEYNRLTQEKNLDHITFVSIVSGKMRRYFDLKNIFFNSIDVIKVVIGTFQSLYHIRYYEIDAVFCKGGYMALPTVFATIILRKPLYIHESDVKYGLTNRIGSYFATTIWTGLDSIGGDNVIYTGQILSPELMNTNITVPEDIIAFGQLYPNSYPIIVTPGSLGSQTIFDQLISIIPAMGDTYRRYIVCGLLNIDYVDKFAHYPNVKIYPKADPILMGILYRQCKGAIVRGGTTTLAECKYYNIKTIALPLQHTHDQKGNTKRYTDRYPDQFYSYDILTPQIIKAVFYSLIKQDI